MSLKIFTSRKNWQREMTKKMKSGEEFILVTDDQELADDLVTGNTKNQRLKNILLEGGTTGSAGGVSIAGLSCAAVFSGVTGIITVADLESGSKVFYAVLATAITAIGAGFVYYLVRALSGKSYEFDIDKENTAGNKIKLKARPSRAALNYCSDQLGIR